MCFIEVKKEIITIFFNKNISLLSQTDDCYHWHYIGNTFRTSLHLFLCRWGLAETPLDTRWKLAESNRIFLLTANPLSLYNILNTHSFFSSGSQFTWFTSIVPLFTPVHILFRNTQLACFQRLICNIGFYLFFALAFYTEIRIL